MVFQVTEQVFKEIEIEDKDIINAMSDVEREEFKALTDIDEQLDFLGKLGWDIAWNSDDWIIRDVDCIDNWIEQDFDTKLMEEI